MRMDRRKKLDDSGGITDNDGILRDVACDHRAGADHGPAADFQAGKDGGIDAEKDPISNIDTAGDAHAGRQKH